MKRHRTLAFFVPNAGCPHRCSFCDQCEISGTQHPPTPQQLAQQCDALLPPPGASEMEIAFFGGSFTALAPAYRAALLAAAAPFVRAQRAAGIRVSTRPDAITPAILQELKAAGVCAVELGAQSKVVELGADFQGLQLAHRHYRGKQVWLACVRTHSRLER